MDNSSICQAEHCTNYAQYTCKRCGKAKFCSTSCLHAFWPQHKKVCCPKESYVGTKPYIWNPPDTTTRHVRYLQSEMRTLPMDQPMDPPDDEEHELLNQFWKYVSSVFVFFFKKFNGATDPVYNHKRCGVRDILIMMKQCTHTKI